MQDLFIHLGTALLPPWHVYWIAQMAVCCPLLPQHTEEARCHHIWCSLRDMLYRRRMERQLAQARGLMSGEGKLPPPEDGEVSFSEAGLP